MLDTHFPDIDLFPEAFSGCPYEELKAGFWKHGQFGSRRILSAFPGLRHSRYAQLLSELKEELSRKNRDKGA